MKHRITLRTNPSLLQILIVALCISSFVKAQTIRCAAMENLERLKELYPDMEATRQSIEEQTQDFINNQASQKTSSSAMSVVYRIPVVVHVVYNTSSQNITDAQVQSQIDVLNEDFRRLNSDKINTPSGFSTIAADCEIEFCLASVDPSGNPTNGIVRKQTTVTSWSQNDAVKYTANGGSNAWNTAKYLNLWVCNLGGGLLGYAQFPGGPAATDGVVINYKYFGRNGSAVAPYNKGRTGTHEVGHWLNLYHIWGDDGGACTGSDQVSDTPNQGSEHYGCPSFPSASCSNGTNGDMFMNYMDYTDDACMNMFTSGQKSRMIALFSTGGARSGLVTSNGCGTGTTTPAYCAGNSTTTQYEYINNVTLNTINNTTTGNGGYSNYTAQSTSLTKGSAYTISLKPGYTGSTYSEYFKVYIDYNGDKDFVDAGENVYSSAATTTTVSASISIPSTAVSGATRMRVIMSDAAITSPCGTFNYGEVEDYTVNLVSGTTTSCGTPSGLYASSVTSAGATLNWSAVSGAGSYTVRYRKTATTTWMTSSSATTSKLISGLLASTQYEFQVQAVCSGTGGSYSGSSLFTTTATTTTGSSVTVTVGTGTTSTSVAPYGSYYMDERSQFIITQSELAAAGWTSANSYLRSLAFYVTTASTQTLNGFTIKIAQISASSFTTTSFLAPAFTTVYSGNVVAAANTWNTYNFTGGFAYNGTSNLLVEICWNNSTYTTNSPVRFTATSAYRALYYRADLASGGVCSNATGTRTYNRPNMRMVFKSTATGKLYGEEEESTIVPAALSNMNVYPNPASDNVTMQFTMDEEKEITVRLFDMMGRTVIETTQSVNVGDNSINLNVSMLETGNYILFVDDGAQGAKKRLIISK